MKEIETKIHIGKAIEHADIRVNANHPIKNTIGHRDMRSTARKRTVYIKCSCVFLWLDITVKYLEQGIQDQVTSIHPTPLDTKA